MRYYDMRFYEKEIFVGLCDNLLDGISNSRMILNNREATVESDSRKQIITVIAPVCVIGGNNWYIAKFEFCDCMTKMRLFKDKESRRFYSYDFSIPCEENVNSCLLSRLWEE